MHVQKFTLSPPPLEEIAETLKAPLSANFKQSSVSVVQCPNLRRAPFNLATEGLSGDERIADVGGQSNLFPAPQLDRIWSMPEIAKSMEMSSEKGSLIGAGAGTFDAVGQNCELCANLSWRGGFDTIDNQSRFAQVNSCTGAPEVQNSPSHNCAMMINLYGSLGEPGPVIKITARKRKGQENSFTACIRKGLHEFYGDAQTISLGGVFLIKSGRTRFHIMPDFPPQDDMPFKDFAQLNSWLTSHEFNEPMVCLSVVHSADPEKAMGLRMEHAHGFSLSGNAGGHYHYDMDGSEDVVEYEAYFNTAKMIYRVDRPEVTLDRDLHD